MSVITRGRHFVLAMDLTPAQIRFLENLHKRSFEIVAFPMYANHIGIRKGNCAALLAPAAPPANTFTIFGSPSYLLNGNLTVKVRQHGRDYFVWKKERLEATSERLDELDSFARELTAALQPS